MYPAARVGALVILTGVICGLCASARSDAQGESAAPQSKSPASYTTEGADTCLNCHEDASVLGVFKTKHGTRGDARSPFGHGQLQCEACHGPGGPHASRTPRGQPRAPIVNFGQKSGTPIDVQNAQCLQCHQQDLTHGWSGNAHASAGIGCADCHASHLPKDPVLTASASSGKCMQCHQTTRLDILKPFSHPIREGKLACTSCHAPHGPAAEHLLTKATSNETCNSCHAEKRGPFLWEHAPVAENCGLCHAPHGSALQGMLKQRAPLLCQTCHSQATHPSVPLSPQGIAGSGTPSSYLVGGSCLNCHSQVHGSNHPSGSLLMR